MATNSQKLLPPRCCCANERERHKERENGGGGAAVIGQSREVQLLQQEGQQQLAGWQIRQSKGSACEAK